MKERYQDEEITIDLTDLFRVLRVRIWVILFSGLVVGVLALIGTKLLLTPIFDSTTKIYVLNKQDGANVTTADLQSGTYLTKDYMELIKSRTVAEQVISDMGLAISADELNRKITVSTTQDTRILAITLSDKDPKLARDMADAVRDVAAKHIAKVMNIEAVNVVDAANLPEKAAKPSLKNNGIIGFLLGIVLSVGVVVLIYILDDTIKTPDDVERYLGLGVLSSIPIYEKSDQKKKKKLSRKADKSNAANRNKQAS